MAAAAGAEEQQAESTLQSFLGWLLANGGCAGHLSASPSCWCMLQGFHQPL